MIINHCTQPWYILASKNIQQRPKPTERCDEVNNIRSIHDAVIFDELVIRLSFSNPPVANYNQVNRGNGMDARGDRRYNDKARVGLAEAHLTLVRTPMLYCP